MRQFIFVFLCVLTAISLSAQDAQIYRKGSSGYVLSVPYTRTGDQKPKITDDKKQDDKKDMPAQENKEARAQQELQSQETGEFTSGNAIVIQDEQPSEQEESGPSGGEEESAAAAIEEPQMEEEPEQIPAEGDVYPEDQSQQVIDEETAAQKEESIPDNESVQDETVWQEEGAELEIQEELEMEPEPEPVIQEPRPLRQEAVEIGSDKTVKTATVEEIKNNTSHYTGVILEGELTLQLSDREFILTDPTGTLKVELTREAEYFLDNTLLIGSTVRVLGLVKRRMWNDVAVEGIKVKVIIPSGVPLNGESSAAQSRVMQNQDEADDMSSEQKDAAYDDEAADEQIAEDGGLPEPQEGF